eukprot:TRINITY_DN3965_c0_g1_i2.p1 TRINITY_DN3965_c0_g1~~TRINITY_DN3965_c0_g1_i2.p1  ORF type:complete len:178 (+),score=30.68 TRINITY_DN3965_c0_g1_i2:68-601(+)
MGRAGRVGHYAIQWAKQAGATVITTASSPVAKQHCITAGADFVVDHNDNETTARILDFTQGQKVDRIVEVEFGGNLEKSLESLKVGGVIASYSSAQVPEPSIPFKHMMFMDLTLRMVIVYAMPEQAKREAISAITLALENNQLQHRIHSQVGLDQIAMANNEIEKGGFYGCVVLDID